MIHPRLLYGITVWENAFDKHLKRFATLQNKAVKLISGAQWHDHITPSYLKLQIFKLNDLYSHIDIDNCLLILHSIHLE